jgi:predicted nucleotidyltransferase
MEEWIGASGLTEHLGILNNEQRLGTLPGPLCWRSSVDNSIEKAIARVFETHPEIVFASLHGSFVHGPAARDIDIAAHVQPDLLPEGSYIYEGALEQEIQVAAAPLAPRRRSDHEQSPIPFQYQAINGRLIHDRDPEYRSDISSWIVSRYLDLKQRTKVTIFMHSTT